MAQHIPSGDRVAPGASAFFGDDDVHHSSPYHVKPLLQSPSNLTNDYSINEKDTRHRKNSCRQYGEDIVAGNSKDYHHNVHQPQHLPQHHHHHWTTNSFFERGTWVHVTNLLLSIVAIINFGVLVPVTAWNSGSNNSITIRNYEGHTSSNVTSDECNNYDKSRQYYYSFYVPLCTFIFWFGFIGLAYDNFVSGIGKYIVNSDPQFLKTLTRYRLVWHAAGIPLFCIPITIVADHHDLISNPAITMTLVLGCIASSIIESMHWIYYDSNKFILVDLSKSNSKSTASGLAGTISYSIRETKEIIKFLVPVIVWSLYNLITGLLLIWRVRSTSNGLDASAVTSASSLESMTQSGYMLVLSSLVGIITSAINEPNLQLFGEVASLGILWIAFQSIL